MAQISQILDAKGTYVYLKALKAVLDSYLTFNLQPSLIKDDRPLSRTAN